MAKKLTSYEKVNLFGPAVGLGPPAAMAKTKWRPMYGDSV